MYLVIKDLHEFAALVKLIRGENLDVDELQKFTHELNKASKSLIEAEKKQEKKDASTGSC